MVQPLTAGTVFDGDNPGVEESTQYATNMLFDQLGRLPGRGGRDHRLPIFDRHQAGASDIAGPFDAGDGLADYYTAVQLHLTVGTTYYVTVTAYDSKLNESVSATSPGIKILTALTAGTVFDGDNPGVEELTRYATNMLFTSWDGFQDAAGRSPTTNFRSAPSRERPTSPARSMPAMASPTTIPRSNST